MGFQRIGGVCKDTISKTRIIRIKVRFERCWRPLTHRQHLRESKASDPATNYFAHHLWRKRLLRTRLEEREPWYERKMQPTPPPDELPVVSLPRLISLRLFRIGGLLQWYATSYPGRISLFSKWLTLFYWRPYFPTLFLFIYSLSLAI